MSILNASARLPGRERGLILITSLIMIVMLTMVVMVSLSLSLASNDIAKNINGSLAAKAAGQAAIEGIISNTSFLTDPAAVANTPLAVDANGDGTDDYSVAAVAACVGARSVLSSELDDSSAADRKCRAGDSMTNSGIELAAGTMTGNSLCSDTRWNVQATASRANSGGRAVINQGVSVRMPIDDAISSCS